MTFELIRDGQVDLRKRRGRSHLVPDASVLLLLLIELGLLLVALYLRQVRVHGQLERRFVLLRLIILFGERRCNNFIAIFL